MDKIVINGGFPLNGEIEISGAKNSAIKLMAVPLLTDQPVELTNMPNLRDTRFMAKLLEHLGVEVQQGQSKMTLHAQELSSTEAPYDLVRKMRATFNVLGPLLARTGKARVSLPGGCAIGARPVDLHLKALEQLGHLGSLWPLIAQAGAKVSLDETTVLIERGGGRPKAVDMETQAYPGFPTDLQAQFMGLMCLADGVSIIRENIFENRFMHCPELVRMGADITVRGREAVVKGVKEMRGAPVMATDLRASASLINCALAAKGETHIGRVYHLDRGFENIEVKLGQCGARIERQPE